MIKKISLLVLIATCMAWAQRPDTPGTVRQILGSASPAAGQAAPPPPAHIEVTSAAAPAPITVNNSQPSGTSVTPGEVLTTIRPRGGRRDPFVSPISANVPTGPSSNCASGKKCLVIDQIVLRGVVKTATGMIAVVANSLNKAYFLRENDPVFNGYVIQITPDAVVFKESTVDAAGRKGTREIVKKVNPPQA